MHLKVHNLTPGNHPTHVRGTNSVNRGTSVSVCRAIGGICSKQQEIFFAFGFFIRRDLDMRKLFKSVKLNLIVSRPGNSSWKKKKKKMNGRLCFIYLFQITK